MEGWVSTTFMYWAGGAKTAKKESGRHDTSCRDFRKGKGGDSKGGGSSGKGERS